MGALLKNMKIAPTYQKLRGGYYTPKPIADFLAQWAIQTANTEVLEPSCGDGSLVAAAIETLLARGAPKDAIARLVHGVEIDPYEAARTVELGLFSLPEVQLIYFQIANV